MADKGKHKGHDKQNAAPEAPATAPTPVETMTISPDAIAKGAPYPLTCVEGFPLGTSVQVTFPSYTAGFMINQEAKQCTQPTIPAVLDPGTYIVESWVYTIDPATPTRPVFDHAGPTATLTVI